MVQHISRCAKIGEKCKLASFIETNFCWIQKTIAVLQLFQAQFRDVWTPVISSAHFVRWKKNIFYKETPHSKSWDIKNRGALALSFVSSKDMFSVSFMGTTLALFSQRKDKERKFYTRTNKCMNIYEPSRFVELLFSVFHRISSKQYHHNWD